MSRSKYGAVRTEAQEQAALIEWCDLKGHPYNLIFHINNGGNFPVQYKVKLKRMGVRPGVPDLFLPCPQNGSNGLFIEMKRLNGGRESLEQGTWGHELRLMGYWVMVCRGFEEAKKAIEDYLRPKTLMRPSTE